MNKRQILTLHTEIYYFQGDLDQSFMWLVKAADRMLEADPKLRGYRNLQKLQVCPFLAPMRQDPRWSSWLTNTQERIDQKHS